MIDTSLTYTFSQQDGFFQLRPPANLSFDEFRRIQERRQRESYWRKRSAELDGEGAAGGRGLLPYIPPSPFFDRGFGGSNVDIIPNGTVNMSFGGTWQRIDNPSIPIRQQRNGGFDFNQNVNMSIRGEIGEKLVVFGNFDNNASFDFQNQVKVEYTGFEEDIIKKIEIGNVSLPINNSLMVGAQNLFGVKTQMQFGKLYFTAAASTLRGTSESLEVMGGGQGQRISIRASNYDENRHFFIGHFFEQNYDVDQWLRAIPQVVSGVNITRIEVYVINRQANTENIRNVVGFTDLGEGQVIHNPDNPNVGEGLGNVPNQNQANRLWQNITQDPRLRQADQAGDVLERDYGFERGLDFQNINGARKLSPQEFQFNPQLGYLSLNRRLQNDEALAISYEYTYNGQTYKVGEMTEDYQNRREEQTIFLKLLRPANINPRLNTWQLMMKNVYNLNAARINKDNFKLQIVYRDDNTGLDNPSLHEGVNTRDQMLVRLLGLDRLNPNNDFGPDGNFDFVSGITIDPERGYIFFPTTEPFGETLGAYFEDFEQDLIQKYVFDTLYTTTRMDAELFTTQNKFFLEGSYQSGSASEIQLPGLNIAEGSVRVTAGGTPLTEGTDFSVDYFSGRVTIINEGILQSGKPIRVSYEKSDVINFQAKTLFGGRLDYRVNENINIGATYLRVFERPLITRISAGNETIGNSQWGLDVNIREESNFLTKVIDALPTVSTKEKSIIDFSGEFAQLIPGTSNKINGEGTSYIDDFEAVITPLNIGFNLQAWKLASTPRLPDNRFDLSTQAGNRLGLGYKRGHLAWYTIDNIFYRSGGQQTRPGNISPTDLQNHYVRAIRPQEIFRQQDREQVNPNIPVFDLAYFPRERGMYNYNPNLDANGNLANPRSNWAGISRAITSEVDFDRNNVEYLEFWMMDPFITGENGKVIAGYDRQGIGGLQDSNNTTGGKFIINLGDISEDVMRDGRHAFENGLPADGSSNNVVENEWGKVTDRLFLTPAFDNNPDARVNQDIGLDGLNSASELEYFRNIFINQLNLSGEALESVLADPSMDNFRYYLGEDLDAEDLKIIERYKYFNGMEGNSPAQIPNLPFTPSGNNLPDNEDLNNDNTLNEAEDYYEYEMELKPGQMQVGNNYIVDKVTNEINGDEVSWYLFRIPVRQPDRVQGNINGFKSIRFMRMYMTDWQQPVVMRLARMQLVASQYRQYNENLFDRGLVPTPERTDTRFTMRAVNIEEHGQGGPDRAPYVLPPGFVRDRDNTSVIERRLNEQSLELCVENLQEKDARAVFKNVNLNFIQYGRLKMFLHAFNPELMDGEMNAFIRLGTDFDQNYYEIELPLSMTAPGTRSPSDIWPEANEIDFPLEMLYTIKSNRNRERVDLRLPYTEAFDKYLVTVTGRPDISDVQTIMIGVRNPESPDGRPKSVCIWVNEMRVTDMRDQSGYAANARLNLQLADLGNVSGSIRHTTFGYGGVQDRINDRSIEDNTQYDLSASLALDKLIPSKHGLRIPLFMSLEEGFNRPFYDPLDPDVPLSVALDALPENRDRNRYLSQVQDRFTRRSLNFTNVGKSKVKEDAKTHFYDVENLTFGFNYSSQLFQGPNTDARELVNWGGSVLYTYQFEEKPFEPFKNTTSLDKPWLKWLKDFNINPVPTQVTFRAVLDRNYQRTQFRNADLETGSLDANFEKLFRFNRNYDVQWNLSKALQLDYTATAVAIVDEPQGLLDTEAKRDSLLQNLRNFGRVTNFNQQINLTYQIPLAKLPATDWMNATARITSGYDWTTGAFGQADTLGNIATNRREQSLNGRLDFVSLYNKNKTLQRINSGGTSSENVTPRGLPGRGLPTRASEEEDSSSEEEEEVRVNKLRDGLLRALMSLKTVTFNMSQTEGTVLPGFIPRPSYLGMDNSLMAPGWDFILGRQELDFLNEAAQEGWIGASSSQSNPVAQFRQVNMNFTADVEPARDFRITLTANKRYDDNYEEIFRNQGGTFQSLSPNRFGSYGLSIISLRTAFSSNDGDNVSEVFRQFEANREIIRDRIISETAGGEIGLNSQDVLIPSFLTAVRGQSAQNARLSAFPVIPLPNWSVDFSGLTRIESIAQKFQTFNITHRYESRYEVGNFNSSLIYQENLRLNNRLRDTPLPNRVNENNFLIPLYVTNQVVITERFSPLLGINMRTQNNLNINVEYRQERNMALSLSNTQVTEINRKDFVLNLGYTKSDVNLFGLGSPDGGNDLTFNLDLSVGDTRTYQRQIDDISTITNGNFNYQVRPNLTYLVNENLNLQLFLDRVVNEPLISNSFKRANTSFGVNLLYTVAQ
jgi:cell surface protein SprA